MQEVISPSSFRVDLTNPGPRLKDQNHSLNVLDSLPQGKGTKPNRVQNGSAEEEHLRRSSLGREAGWQADHGGGGHHSLYCKTAGFLEGLDRLAVRDTSAKAAKGAMVLLQLVKWRGNPESEQ